MATGPLPPPIPSSLISSSSSNSHSTSSSRSKLPPLLSPSPLPRHNYQQQAQSKKRRELLLKGGLGLLPLALVESILKEPLTVPSAEAKEAVVGSYLPPSPSDPSFVLFKASAKDTPALRAGNVQPYQFIIPPTWKQMRVANILSGNYCQPKCAEPWVEVKFEDEKQGKLQVVASPLIRLTNKPNATIEDIGNPAKVIASLGPFVTGNTYDPDELLETTVERRGDLTYYKYGLETPFALTGSHNLAKATAKGNTVVLFVELFDLKRSCAQVYDLCKVKICFVLPEAKAKAKVREATNISKIMVGTTSTKTTGVQTATNILIPASAASNDQPIGPHLDLDPSKRV